MKKRAIMISMLLVMALSVTGCSQKTATKDKDTKTEETAKTDDAEETESDNTEDTSEDTPTTAELMAGIDVEKCVTLGDYKGVTVEKTIQSVTDEDVQNEIDNALANYPVEVDQAAKEGDTVNIDYVGKIDGEEFDGGSDQGADLKLGSGKFIDGFEDGLIGARKGETRTLNLTFPEDYTQDLAGKAVEFTVTVNAVKEPLSEPTDQWVADNIEGYDNLADYKAGIRSEQEESNEQTAENQVRYAAWTQVIDNCTINEYPETLVEVGKKLYEQQVETYAKYAGMELDAYIESSGLTQEEYQSNMEEYGKNVAAQALVCQAICDKEGFAIGDDDYQKALQDMLTEYGCTEDELIQTYGQDNVEQSIMLNRVSNLILENANVTEVQADSSADSSADDSGN
ncbi:trigger factor [Blautia sp. AM16-16B]|nr:trigger factor [Blautia sp. AM16-16B]RHS52645.1 trigger factor [Blautia sp. AM46-5]RHS56346.1 trigger factor [Blautia sp. AM46-3MH]